MEAFWSYFLTILSDIEFMMAMITIVLIAVCFLGRYVVITRKMLIATLGILAFEILFIIASDIAMKQLYPDVYNMMDKMTWNDAVNTNDNLYNDYLRISNINTYIINAGVFIYAFIFFLISFKEKRILRAIEAEVCLYFYYNYINIIGQYSYIYLRGGDFGLIDSYIMKTDKVIERFYYVASRVIWGFIVTLTILLILYFRYYRKKRFYRLGLKEKKIFIIWFLILAIFPAIPAGAEGDIEMGYGMLTRIFGIMLLFIGAIAPVMIVMNLAEKSLKEKNEYQETYLAAELEYIEQYKRTQTETRAFRHDIINNLSLAGMMMDEGKTGEAREHIRSLLGNVRSLSPSVITGDEMLDCIVAMKVGKMKEIGIDFSLDGVADGGLNMKPMDVCSIFANALDNAIEAAGRQGSAWIKMDIKRTDEFFVIRITNTASEKVDVEKLFMTTGYTSKKDTEHHGFGLRNIRLTAEKYDGLVKAESDDGYFALSVMIPR